MIVLSSLHILSFYSSTILNLPSFYSLIGLSRFNLVLCVKVGLKQTLILLFFNTPLGFAGGRRGGGKRKLRGRFHEVWKRMMREGKKGRMRGVHWSMHRKVGEEGGIGEGTRCRRLKFKYIYQQRTRKLT